MGPDHNNDGGDQGLYHVSFTFFNPSPTILSSIQAITPFAHSRLDSNGGMAYLAESIREGPLKRDAGSLAFSLNRNTHGGI
jgi:hypothetical protein